MSELTTKDALLERMVTATGNLATNVPAKFEEYLPLSGGRMTGNSAKITMGNGNSVISSYSTGIFLCGDTDTSNASFFELYTKSNGNGFVIDAGNGTAKKRLQGKPDGTLAWDGQPIQTSSDKRLKTDFADVPADVLDAWEKVEWKQFKYIADKERKGDSCRFHTGLVAQDVKEIGEENNVNLLKYGILCHDVREATEDSEAVDLWTVRYEEALAMEVIYLRNEIKKLRTEITKLKKKQ